jgi:hypothetical protein
MAWHANIHSKQGRDVGTPPMQSISGAEAKQLTGQIEDEVASKGYLMGSNFSSVQNLKLGDFVPVNFEPVEWPIFSGVRVQTSLSG